MNTQSQMQHAPGPLEELRTGFAQHLASQGYSTRHAGKLSRLASNVDRWLAAEGLGADDLSQSAIARFHDSRRSAGRKELVSARALKPLTDYLRQIGIAAKLEPTPMGAADRLLQRYRHYLKIERGLHRLTARRYAYLVRPFLEGNLAEAAGVEPDLQSLSEAGVIAFVVKKCPAMKPGSASLFVTALRSLLVFLHVDGVIDRSMSTAVPTVPGRRLTGLPKSVTPAVPGRFRPDDKLLRFLEGL